MRAWFHRPAAVCCIVLLGLSVSTVSAETAGTESIAGPTFDIWEIRVQGNSVLDTKVIESTIYPFLGPGRSFDDVQKARTALETAYRDAGYPTVSVDIPEQNVRNGLVKVRVTDGRIRTVRVTGARYYDNGWIRQNLPEAKPGDVLQLDRFNEELSMLNARSADRRVTPVLKPGREPGTVDLELKVADTLPVSGSLEVNNRNTVSTTDTRVVANLSYDNLWQRDHSIGLLYQVAPEDKDESEVWSLTYSFRPERSRTSYSLYAVDSNSDIETTGNIGVIGKGQVYGGRAVIPIQSGNPNLFQSGILGLDYKDFDESIGFEEQQETPITYLNWVAGYMGVVLGEQRNHSIFATANFGIRDLVNDTDEFDDKRTNARPNYLYVRGSYDVTQKLPGNLSAFFKVSGQYSQVPLISNEQFSAGGLDTVRGYFEAEALGDRGFHTTLELRSPDFNERLPDGADALYVYLFGDLARLRSESDPNIQDEETRQSLSSAGVGLRFDGYGFTSAFHWAQILSDGPVSEKDSNEFLFRVRYGF